MCRVCDWGKHLAAAGSASPSRRTVLRATAAVGAATAAKTMFGFAATAMAQQKPPGIADLVFRNGPVFTVNPRQAWASAVAVRDGVIVYVGDDGGVGSFVGKDTRVIDLAGKLLLPGFVEGHIHPLIGAAITHGLDLQYDTRAQTLKALAAWRDKAGKVDVVRGFGWRYSAFPASGPVKADLDALWPDTPVILLAVDAHSAWVNSKALQLAGITRNSGDPQPGFSIFQRDAKGDPTGWLIEVPAVMQVMREVAPITEQFVASALAEWMPRAAAAGITSLFDAGILVVSDKVGLGFYEALEKSGHLPCRVLACHYHNDPSFDPLPAVRKLRDRARTALVQARVLKLNLDGVDAQHTAAMLGPYSDRPDTIGRTIFNPALARDTVIRADGEGFDVHFHAIGDRAVRLALDTVEAAIRSNGPRERRHTIAHLSLIDDDDLKRFAELGVIAQFSAQWAQPDAYWATVTKVRWGALRAAKTYRIGSVLRSGATVTLGTDWPAAAHRSTFRPLDALEVAVTRCEPGRQDQMPLSPAAERLTLEQAVQANTLAAARQLRLDDKVGSIDVGKRGDLVMLDRNIFEGPQHEIHAAKVLLTAMDGVIRHEAG